MALFPKLFGHPTTSGRKVRVSDRLDQFVAPAARQPDERADTTYVIDKNYEIVYTDPAPRK